MLLSHPNNMLSRLLISSFLLTLPAASLAEVDFAHQVMPVLQEHCAECHTGKKKKGGLAMNTRAELLEGSEFGDVVTSGDAADSLMIELIHSTDDDEWMPPKGPRLNPQEIAILEKWINEGMKWDESIRLGKSAWQPPLKPRQVKLPAAQQGREHPIDRILDADMKKREQSPPVAATDAAFIRRATLDVHGLLPTPDELASFLADTEPKKRESHVRKLLANDVSYADHWLTMWNDLLRNDYTGTGYITKGRQQITGWLYQALKENKPYDQFVRELIAPTPESAGFINGIKWRGDVNASQTREIQFSQNISQVFLGINMKCASCHDSFIDNWKLEEAYNLAAIFSDKPLELNRCDKPTGKMAKPKWIFPELGDIDPKAPKEERLKQLAGLMTHPENGRLTRTVVNRIWERLMGRGIVHPVDAMDAEPWNEDLLDYLACRFAEDGYDLRSFIGFVMSSKAYQSRSVILKKEPGEDYRYAGPLAKRMTAEQFVDSVWQVLGAHPKKATAKVDRKPKDPAAKSLPVRVSLVESDFLTRSLGRPNRDQVVTTRPRDLTTLQAIDLANGDQLAGYLSMGAKALQQKGMGAQELIDWLYRHSLSRPLASGEQKVLEEIINVNTAADASGQAHAIEDLLWLVFMQPEFQIIR